MKKKLTHIYGYDIFVKQDVNWVFFLCQFCKRAHLHGVWSQDWIRTKVKIRNASGGGIMRTKITLACTECKQRNYNTTKEKKNHPDRMEIKKYCRFCKTHTLHKETK